jgi:uncharacterized protein (TIGR02246 family)
MRITRSFVFVVLILMLVAMAGCSGSNDTAEDVAMIEGIWDEYTATVNEGDTEGWLALWAEEGLRVTPSDFGPRQHGKEEIRAVIEPTFAAFTFEIDIDSEGVEVLGEQAYSYGTFVMSFTPKDGVETTTINGNFMTIFEKQDDGSWEILIDTWNY